jgi:hypothetical protein
LDDAPAAGGRRIVSIAITALKQPNAAASG